MRVIVVTGELPHHKNLCVALSERHKVVGIIHPRDPEGKRTGLWNKLRRRIRGYGIAHTMLNLLSRSPGLVSGWRSDSAEREAEDAYFPTAVRRYEAIDQQKVHRGVDVTTAQAAELIRNLGADVAVCLGGPIYPKSFIETCPLVLNYHCGLSPLYNGAWTIRFGFANGQPHLCGGTLMTMSTVVDGGRILGHYLPEIRPEDTPATLFMKTALGAVQMYDQFLNHLEQHGMAYVAIPQTAPLFYMRGADWTIYHTQMVRRHLRNQLASKYVRPELMISYWLESDESKAQHRLCRMLSGLLCAPKQTSEWD